MHKRDTGVVAGSGYVAAGLLLHRRLFRQVIIYRFYHLGESPLSHVFLEQHDSWCRMAMRFFHTRWALHQQQIGMEGRPGSDARTYSHMFMQPNGGSAVDVATAAGDTIA